MSQAGPTSHRQKVVVIGLDGAPPHLVRRWAEDGHLPHFARLYREGAGGVMASTPQCDSAPAWSSFATGLNPGRHGVFAFMNRVRDNYECRRVCGLDRQGLTSWDVAGDQGRRCAILSVPVTYPAQPLNGAQVAGWLCPSLRSPGATWPEALGPELSADFPGYHFHADIKRHAVTGRDRRAFGALRQGLERKAEIGRRLFAREPWDLFVLTFVETDAAQHYYLHTSDETHPLHAEAVVRGLGGALLEVYKQVDGILGDLMTRLDDETTLVVMSDHGATANIGHRAHLRGLLEDLGLLRMRRSNGSTGLLRECLVKGRQLAYSHLRAHLPRSAKRRLNRLLPGTRERLYSDVFTAGVDWERTRAYAYRWDTDPRLNLRGREPRGVVAQGAEYEAVCAELTAMLLAARELQSGKPAVRAVRRGRELFHGPHADMAPDLVIEWHENRLLHGLVSAVDGREVITRPGWRDDTVGAHHPEALLLLWGRAVRPGKPDAGATIMDLAPSILALLGCQVPDDLDGQALGEALDVSGEYAAQSPSAPAAHSRSSQ